MCVCFHSHIHFRSHLVLWAVEHGFWFAAFDRTRVDGLRSPSCPGVVCWVNGSSTVLARSGGVCLPRRGLHLVTCALSNRESTLTKLPRGCDGGSLNALLHRCRPASTPEALGLFYSLTRLSSTRLCCSARLGLSTRLCASTGLCCVKYRHLGILYHPGALLSRIVRMASR